MERCPTPAGRAALRLHSVRMDRAAARYALSEGVPAVMALSTSKMHISDSPAWPRPPPQAVTA